MPTQGSGEENKYFRNLARSRGEMATWQAEGGAYTVYVLCDQDERDPLNRLRAHGALREPLPVVALPAAQLEPAIWPGTTAVLVLDLCFTAEAQGTTLQCGAGENGLRAISNCLGLTSWFGSAPSVGFDEHSPSITLRRRMSHPLLIVVLLLTRRFFPARRDQLSHQIVFRLEVRAQSFAHSLQPFPRQKLGRSARLHVLDPRIIIAPVTLQPNGTRMNSMTGYAQSRTFAHFFPEVTNGRLPTGSFQTRQWE